MKTHPPVLLAASLLCALTGISFGQPAPLVPSVIIGPSDLLRPSAMAAPAAATTKDGVMKNLRKELPGTKWKAVAGAQLKGGLVASMSFTEKTVEPGGYKYEALSKSLTMTFTHGAKLELELSKDGKHLEYPRGEIVFERVME